jgi:hypothetical protein
MSQKGSEVFYIDENGRKADAAIHEEILAGISPEDDLKNRTESFHFAVGLGIDPEKAARAFGLPGAYDLDPGPKSLR